MSTMEMCGACEASVQARLQLKSHSAVLILLLLIGYVTFGFLSIPVWLLTFFGLFTFEGLCPICGSFLFESYICSKKLRLGDKAFIYKQVKSPIWLLWTLILVSFLATMITGEVLLIEMFRTDQKTDFANHLIDRSEFQEKLLQSVDSKALFTGPINTFHRSYINSTFNFTGKNNLGFYLGDERADRLWCKKISLSSVESSPDFEMCFHSPETDRAKCDFGVGKEVPVVVGCVMKSVGMIKNVTYVLCTDGWVAPLVRGGFQCKDDQGDIL